MMLYSNYLRSILAASFIVFVGTIAVQAAPKLKFDSDKFDFGFTPEGLPVMHKYWAYNVGTDTLMINRVSPSCGCTSVPLTKNRLAPGDSVALELKFDTKRFKGQITKTAAVKTNDESQPDAKIEFTARVGKWEGAVIANPSEVYLDTLGKTEQKIILKNTSAGPYKISVVSPLAEFMHFELSDNVLTGRGEATITIRTTPETPIGIYHASVTLHLDGQQPHNISIPIYGMGFVQ